MIAHSPLCPGNIIKEQYLQPLKLTPYTLAKRMGISRRRLERVLRGESRITVDTAARLAKYFGTSVEHWLHLQLNFDAMKATSIPNDELSYIRPHCDW
ncbi:addiction module antidote protein, HigA family [Rhodobacteraceae bacterium RKSG542]|uniref:HigA family addiction module antitoxin n=1 Tax=Pseudovibrio flavus TaxID=2529854 RepID=UPI0012BCFBA3|nr:HigA family addiction module antitoxin [Pseudovibrio flavus]MTI17477.1 addiction module antidote protein, HigA family [Pseudovibrio flavus]